MILSLQFLEARDPLFLSAERFVEGNTLWLLNQSASRQGTSGRVLTFFPTSLRELNLQVIS